MKITVVTPTYNRGYILGNLYESLVRQTDQNFLWLVVDDGSSDHTGELLNGWISENVIKIQSLKKKNGGKHTAINLAIKHVKTDYVFIVDSDDYLCDDAIETIHGWIETYKDGKKSAGYAGTKGNSQIGIIGGFPKNCKSIICTNLERRKLHLLGDKSEVYKTELLSRFPFPEYKNETFLPEDVVWNKIAAEGYHIRWFPKMLTICEYREDGLTKSAGQTQFENNIYGFCDSYYKNWKYLPFPYNYSSAAEFYKKYAVSGRQKKDVPLVLEMNRLQYLMLRMMRIMKCFYGRGKRSEAKSKSVRNL